MLNESLLVSLGSLRRLERKLFIAEDFLTAALSFLLKNDRVFLRAYLNHVGFQLNKLPDVQTQKSYGEAAENIPDMVLSDRETYIIQENKIDARLGKNQLRRYAELVNESGKKTQRFDLSSKKASSARGHPCSVDGVRIRPLTWNAVGSFIKRSGSGKRNDLQWLREEICKFLEFYKMTYPSGLDISKLRRSWIDFEPQQKALRRMIEDVHQRIMVGKDYRLNVSRPGEHPGFTFTENEGN